MRGEWLPTPSRSVQLPAADARHPVITAIAVDPRGEYIAVAGDDHLIRILNTRSLDLQQTLSGHQDLIRCVAFDPSGNRLASAGNDGQLMVWDREQSFQASHRLAGFPSLRCVAFSPDGSRLAAVGFEPDIYLLRPGGSDSTTLRGTGRDLRALAFRDDGRLLAVVGRNGSLTLFDLSRGEAIRHPIHEGRIHDVAFHYHTNRAVCVGEDGYLSVFDTLDRALLYRIPVTTGKLFAVAVLSSQLVAVAGSDDVIRIVNTDERKLVRRLEGHRGSVSSLAAGGGLLYSGSYDTTLRSWGIADIGTDEQRIAEGDPRLDR